MKLCGYELTGGSWVTASDSLPALVHTWYSALLIYCSVFIVTHLHDKTWRWKFNVKSDLSSTTSAL